MKSDKKILDIKHISAGFKKKCVLNGLSLQIMLGEHILLTGENGSGKSTLLKCLAKQLPLWEGNILYKEKNLTEYDTKSIVKEGLLYIPQQDFCFYDLTVMENLQIACLLLCKRTSKKRINYALERTGLEAFRNRKPFNLSGGELKLLAAAIAILHQPTMLLFDEPFAGVDATNRKKLQDIFSNELLRTDSTAIIIEHSTTSNHLFNRKISMQLGNIKYS